MIASLFRAAIDRHPDRPFLEAPSGSCTYAEFFDRCQRFASTLRAAEGERIGCHAPDAPDLVALLFASALAGRHLLLFNHDTTGPELAELAAEFDVAPLVTDIAAFEGSASSTREAGSAKTGEESAELLILTSGTTGRPKCARYRWSDLVAQISERGRPTDHQRWLLAYHLNHFAGIQMLLHVLVRQQTLVLPESKKVSDALHAATRFGVTHMSSTPTFWRFALATLPEDRGALPLRQITLGSEAVSGDLLERLKERFPSARIVHIYATTETGSCISVDDGLPGLPDEVLDRPDSARVQFKVEDEELFVRTQHGMSGYLGATADAAARPGGWRATGDLVEVENGRIHFKGRRSEVVNVGGVKVHPQEVEAVIAAAPGVKVVRAYGKKNPVAGQIVAADIVLQDGFEESAVEDAVRDACLELSRHSRPRLLNFVDDLSTNNYKIERK